MGRQLEQKIPAEASATPVLETPAAIRRQRRTHQLRVAAFATCAMYVFTMFWLLVIAIALGAIRGYAPTVIESDSMAPLIRTGDVVLNDKLPHDEIGPATVVTFHQPGNGNRLVTHRVVAVGDGVVWTKGDANVTADSSPVPFESIVGVGRLLVPFVAVPIVWATSGDYLFLVAWMLVTVLAIDVVATGPQRHRRLHLARLFDRVGDRHNEDDDDDEPPPKIGLMRSVGHRLHPKYESRRLARRSRGEPEPEIEMPSTGLLLGLVLFGGTLVLASVGVHRSAAAFADQTANPANTFAAMEWGQIDALAAGSDHACAMLRDGTVWCWGRNHRGQLGDDTGVDSDDPVQVVGAGGTGTFEGGVQLGSGDRHSCAVHTDTTVWCWGHNNEGQLGDDSTSNSDFPVQVVGVGGTGTLSGIVAVTGGAEFTCGLGSSGGVWCWGRNHKGQLGDDTTTNSLTPVRVTGEGGTGFLGGIVEISAGRAHACGRNASGAVWCWGWNDRGQLGDESSDDSAAPVRVVGEGGIGLLSGTVAISSGRKHNCAAGSSGQAWCWGLNDSGQLGDDTTDNSDTPERVAGPGGVGNFTGAVDVGLGDKHSCAIKSDATLWCWGRNDDGQLGDGSTTQAESPVQVSGIGGTGTLSSVKLVTGGMEFTCAARTNRTVACWGLNNFGQLGDGTGVDSGVPVLVAL